MPTITTIADPISKAELCRDYKRSSRQFTRDVYDAIRVDDMEFLGQVEVHLLDETIIPGIEIKAGQVQDLFDQGKKPEWYASASWAAKHYGRRLEVTDEGEGEPAEPVTVIHLDPPERDQEQVVNSDDTYRGFSPQRALSPMGPDPLIEQYEKRIEDLQSQVEALHEHLRQSHILQLSPEERKLFLKLENAKFKSGVYKSAKDDTEFKSRPPSKDDTDSASQTSINNSEPGTEDAATNGTETQQKKPASKLKRKTRGKNEEPVQKRKEKISRQTEKATKTKKGTTVKRKASGTKGRSAKTKAVKNTPLKPSKPRKESRWKRFFSR